MLPMWGLGRGCLLLLSEREGKGGYGLGVVEGW
jgi:hypothetical protein